MKYNSIQLEKLKKIELEILQETIRVCEKNGITYFTVGGTTLGAVRHNGFIPWDDDIDIGMLREDYEKFLEIAPGELSNGFTITHFRYDYNVPTYFAKVRKDGTKFVESYTEDIDMHQGVFIDVFPYDYVPENILLQDVYLLVAKFWNQLFIAKSVNSLTFHAKKNVALLKTIRKGLHVMMKPVSKAFLYNMTDNALRKYNECKSTWVCSRALKVFLNNTEDLLPPVEHRFENIKVRIPANAHNVLTKQYGNYSQLPPEEDRYNHMPTVLELDNR